MLSVLLAGTMLSSAGAICEAATLHSYDFFMLGEGGSDRSNDRNKEISGDARVNIKSISTSASPLLPLTMRVRRASDDGKATPPRAFSKDERGSKYLKYNSRYGYKGERYYLKMQTNSDASQCAWVDGTWRP